MKLPDSGIGKFVLENFEKAIFGVIALVGLLLIYSAFSAEKYPSERVPENLIAEASRAKQAIQDGRWDNYKENYKDNTLESLEIIKNAEPLEPDYPLSVIIKGERLQLRKRFDPTLLAVQDLEVNGVWDSVLWYRGSNKVSSLPEGELRKRASQEKKKPKKKTPRRRPMRGEGGEDEGMREMMEAMNALQEEEEMMFERVAEAGAAANSGSQLPELIANEMAGIRVKSGKGKGLVGGYFVSVTGIVPFRQQIIEFRKLSQTLGYDPQKDYPRYVKVDVERMDAAATDGRWENITAKLTQFPELSHMIPPEICDVDYLDERIAMQSLPLLRTDPAKFGLHSKIPQRVWFEEEEEDESAADKEPEDIDLDNLLKRDTKATTEKDPRSATMMDQMRMRSPGRTKVKVLEPDEAPEFKLVRFSDFVGPGKSYQYRVRLILIDPNLPMQIVTGKEDADRSSNPEFADAGEMSDEEMMMRMQMDMEEVDSGAGAKKVTLTHGNSKIHESNLEAEVRDRLNKLQSSERFNLEDKDLKFGIYTDWSEPSPVVTAPKPQEQFYAGGVVEVPKLREYSNVSFEVGRPSVELVMSKWSPFYSYKLPAYATVYEGSTLNVKQTIKLIDPIGLKIREIRGLESADSTEKEPKYEGFEVNSNAVVLDISGGNPLPNKNRSEKEFKEPAEVLIFDGENFVLTDELQDMREFREHALFEVDNE